MAAEYAAQIAEHHRGGSFFIGGWSMGGVVAFEIASQLRAVGRESECVLLLDSIAPGYRHDMVPESELMLGVCAPLFTDSPMPFTKGELESLTVDMHDWVFSELVRLGKLPPDADRAVLEREFRAYQNELSILAAYRPDTSQGGRFVLVRASDGFDVPLDLPPSFDRDSNGWRPLIGPDLIVEPARGTHNTMLKPENAYSTAMALRHWVVRSSDGNGLGA